MPEVATTESAPETKVETKAETEPSGQDAPASTVEELATRLAKIEQDHKLTVGRLTREVSKYKKASELDSETLAALTKAETLEERETALLAREYGVDPEVLTPYDGLEAKEKAAQKWQASGQAQVKVLQEQIAALQKAGAPSKPQRREPGPQGSMVGTSDLDALLNVDTRGMSMEMLRQHEKALDGALAQTRR